MTLESLVIIDVRLCVVGYSLSFPLTILCCNFFVASTGFEFHNQRMM